jgi:hypothetical protein
MFIPIGLLSLFFSCRSHRRTAMSVVSSVECVDDDEVVII